MTRSRSTLTDPANLNDGHRHPITTLDPSKAADRRLKARERQRRKRERDRQNNNNNRIGAATFRAGPVAAPALMPDAPIAPAPAPPPPPPLIEANIPSASASTSTSTSSPQHHALRRVHDDVNMSEDEIARRDRVRESARLRQQKHRALVKQRKLAELGLAMNPDGLGGLEEMHFAVGPDGTYQPVLPPPPPQQPILPDHHTHHHHQPPAFPTGHTGGASFASTLLLSFSCSPLLKQHLLRTLHMTNEELASLEPVLAAAWDQWDHARRMHYAEQAAKVSQQQQQQQQQPQNGSGSASTSSSTAGQAGPSNGQAVHSAVPPPPFTVAHPPPGVDPTSLGNDYRARFHRPLTAPSLFSSGGHDAVPSTALSGTGTGTEVSATGANGVNLIASNNGDMDEGSSDSDGKDDGDGDADGDADLDMDMGVDKDDEDVDASI